MMAYMDDALQRAQGLRCGASSHSFTSHNAEQLGFVIKGSASRQEHSQKSFAFFLKSSLPAGI